MFASLTAHTAAVLLAVIIAIPGIAVRPLALLMCYSLGLMGVVTPYATGPSPIWLCVRLSPVKGFLAHGMPDWSFLSDRAARRRYAMRAGVWALDRLVARTGSDAT